MSVEQIKQDFERRARKDQQQFEKLFGSSPTVLERSLKKRIPSALFPCISWLFDTGESSPARHKADQMVRCSGFEHLLAMAICFNIYLVILETDAYAGGPPTPGWLNTCAFILMGFYVIELIVRFFASRMRMFYDPQVILDVFLVVYDIFMISTHAGGGLSALRIIRLVKIGRTFQFLNSVPELHLMMKGLLGAIRAMFWGSVLCAIMVLFWSILAVHFVDPLNREIAQETNLYAECHRCARAFSSVGDSSLSIVEMVLEGVGPTCVPLVEKNPWAGLFFYLVYASISVTALNLILAVIVDSAQEARKHSMKELIHDKEREWTKAQKELRRMFVNLDTDADGRLCLHELEAGFEANLAFSNACKLLDIKVSDLPQLFEVLDHDLSGTVDFEEFTTEMWKLRTKDVQALVVNTRLQLTLIRKQILDEMSDVSGRILKKIDAQEKLSQQMIEAAISTQEKLSHQMLEATISTNMQHLTNILTEEEKRLEQMVSTKMEDVIAASASRFGTTHLLNAQEQITAHFEPNWPMPSSTTSPSFFSEAVSQQQINLSEKTFDV